MCIEIPAFTIWKRNVPWTGNKRVSPAHKAPMPSGLSQSSEELLQTARDGIGFWT